VKASALLSLAVVAPVIAGYLLSRWFESWQRVARPIGAAVANLTILWIIAVVVGINRDRLQFTDLRLIAALVGLNLLGYAAGYTGGLVLRLDEPMRRALTIEIGMQNAGLGTALVLTLLKDVPGAEAAAIPTALYTFGCMLTGVALARTWALTDDLRGTHAQPAATSEVADEP
jgi:BASS family bile acid:Na+ symporter